MRTREQYWCIATACSLWACRGFCGGALQAENSDKVLEALEEARKINAEMRDVIEENRRLREENSQLRVENGVLRSMSRGGWLKLESKSH